MLLVNAMNFQILCSVLLAGIWGISGTRLRPHRNELRHVPETAIQEVCYTDLGCFSNAPPFTNADGALPLERRFIQTAFRLYRRHTRLSKKLVLHDVQRLDSSGFDPQLPTKIVTHGFEQNGQSRWILDLVREFLRKENMNVITVDWGSGSGFPYTQAVANSRLVGAEIAALVQFVNNQTGAQLSQYHLIGHSLGAHVVGYAGARLSGLRRITGLDPAQPNYEGFTNSVRLDRGDAQFVDVIHTDDSNFSEISGYGMRERIGHIDFYPNGGHDQPGCSRASWTGLVEHLNSRGIDGTANTMACSHSRSIFLFMESINSNCPFRAFLCNNSQDFLNGNCFSCGNRPCPSLGYNANSDSAEGKFYLATAASPPYCGYHYHLSLELGPTMELEEGTLFINLLGSNRLSETFTIEGPFEPNQRRGAMFLSHEDLGEILHTQIRFVQESGYFSWLWRARTVAFNRAVVHRGETRQRSFFCGNDTVLTSGQQRGFQRTTGNRDCGNSPAVSILG